MAVALADKSHDPVEQKAQQDLMKWGLPARVLLEIETDALLQYAPVRDEIEETAREWSCSPAVAIDSLCQPPRRRARGGCGLTAALKRARSRQG